MVDVSVVNQANQLDFRCRRAWSTVWMPMAMWVSMVVGGSEHSWMDGLFHGTFIYKMETYHLQKWMITAVAPFTNTSETSISC